MKINLLRVDSSFREEVICCSFVRLGRSRINIERDLCTIIDYSRVNVVKHWSHRSTHGKLAVTRIFSDALDWALNTGIWVFVNETECKRKSLFCSQLLRGELREYLLYLGSSKLQLPLTKV